MADENLDDTGAEASQDDLDLLNEGADEETEETPSSENESEETKDEPSSEEESEELEDEEVEEETEEETQEEEEDEEEKLITRPSWREIKEKYPELAKNKDFREVFHRERAYSDLFPTVDDAKDASEKAKALEFFDDSLVNGDPTTLFTSLEPKVVAKLAENVLPALYQIHPSLFGRATRPMLVNMLNNVARKAEETSDKNLLISAKNVSKYLFGKFEIPAPENRNPEVDAEVKRLQDERQQLQSDRQKEFVGKIERSIVKQLQRVISDGIDPKNELSEFTRKAIIEKVISETRQTLISDKNFSEKIANLVRAAQKAGYPSDYMPRVISAYLGRAKSLALGLRAKHKATAVVKKPSLPKTRIEGASEKGITKQNSNGKDTKGKKSDLDIIMEGAG